MEPVASGLTYDDLATMPDDNLRRELIAGELFVSPAPSRPHQECAGELFVWLRQWCRRHGAKVYLAPTDVLFGADTVLEPDLLVVRPERVALLRDERFVEVAPDLVVEVSSPSTRAYDLLRKRRAYEQHGVAEFWFVDLDARRIEVYRLGESGYGPPELVEAGGTVASQVLEGLRVPVDELFGPVA